MVSLMIFFLHFYCAGQICVTVNCLIPHKTIGPRGPLVTGAGQAKYSIFVCDPFPQLPINEQLTNRMYPWSFSFVDPWSWLFRFYLKVRFSPNHIDDIFSILAQTPSSYLKKKNLKITLLVVSLVYTRD